MGFLELLTRSANAAPTSSGNPAITCGVLVLMGAIGLVTSF